MRNVARSHNPVEWLEIRVLGYGRRVRGGNDESSRPLWYLRRLQDPLRDRPSEPRFTVAVYRHEGQVR